MGITHVQHYSFGVKLRHHHSFIHSFHHCPFQSYVHRSGRTARASKEGLSVILIDSSESLSYKKICHTLKRVEDLPLFPVDSSVYSSVKARMQVNIAIA